MEMYQNLCVQFYDIDKPTAPKEALDFYLKYAEKANGPILEPMSGSGRFLLPLLERGYDIDGVDASPSMISACKKHGERMGLNPRVYEQFLNELDLPKQYSLVFLPVGSLGLIIEEEPLKNTLKKIHEHMLPGGTFVFEVDTIECKPTSFNQVTATIRDREDGAKIVMNAFTQSFDSETSVLRSIHRYELYKDGKLLESELEDFRLKLYTKESITKLLEQCGFVNIQAFQPYTNLPPFENSQEMVIECKRP
jgi:2-polyprenyl-3-methyl-5-hydroxy-6-metoxy-1,4-benzoquinol methylase